MHRWCQCCSRWGAVLLCRARRCTKCAAPRAGQASAHVHCAASAGQAGVPARCAAVQGKQVYMHVALLCRARCTECAVPRAGRAGVPARCAAVQRKQVHRVRCAAVLGKQGTGCTVLLCRASRCTCTLCCCAGQAGVQSAQCPGQSWLARPVWRASGCAWMPAPARSAWPAAAAGAGAHDGAEAGGFLAWRERLVCWQRHRLQASRGDHAPWQLSAGLGEALVSRSREASIEVS